MRRILILLALCLFPSLVSAQIDLDKMRHKQELDALRGFKDFAVLSVTVDGSGAGLEASELGRAITARLAQKGAPVAASAVLNLRVNLRVRSDPRLKGFAVAVAVEAWQFVQVERSNSFERAVLWERDDLVITDGTWRELRASLAGITDEFASDFLVSNPETYRR